MGIRDAQLRGVVRHTCNWLKRVRNRVVVCFVEQHVVQWEKRLRMRHPRGFFQNIKLVLLEEIKEIESKYIRDEEGRLLRGKKLISERWVQFFRLQLKEKSDMLDPDIPKRLPKQPVANALGTEPTEEKAVTVVKEIANVKAVGPDGLPMELLKLGLQQDRTLLLQLLRLVTLLWREGKLPKKWKDAVVTVFRKNNCKKK